MKKKILLLCGLFFTFSYLPGLVPQKAVTQYKQDTWQAAQGLEPKCVYSICQTHDGYIWLGTPDGLVRFDGDHFKIFKKENTKNLHDNRIWALLEDKTGNLWIGTAEGGLSCLKNGKFKTYSMKNYPALKDIYTIFQDREGDIWVGTLNSGLTRFQNGKPITFTTEHGLASNRVHALHQDDDGRLWLGTSAGLSIREHSGKFITYTGRNDRDNKYILSMCKTKKEELWLGCLDGLCRLKNNTFTHFGKKAGLLNPKIKSLFVDSDQNLWAGTESGGLIRIKDDKIETFPPTDELAIDTVYSIHEDMEKNLWIGTLKGGLHRLKDTVFTSYTTREGLSHDLVHCISKSRAGNLWLGTDYGVNRMDDGHLTLELTTRNKLLSNRVTAIMEDTNGMLWIGTDVGLNRYKDGKRIDFNFQTDGLNSYILQLAEDQKGRVVILSEKNLGRFHKGKFKVLKKEESDKFLIHFCIDQEGILWLATYGGGIFRIEDEEITAFTTKEGLVNNEVECIYEDKKGILYIGTRGGLSILANGEFTNRTTQDGLLENLIYQITEDELGYLWLTGGSGFSRINKKELSDFANKKIKKINTVLFDESDGVKDPFCNQCIKTGDGKLWFATEGGVVVTDPSNIMKNKLPPPVVLEELRVDGETISLNEPQCFIPPGKKRLEFYFTGLSFVKPQQIKFKLKLEGYDEEWIDSGHNRSTTYTGLSHGKYTFRVKACNSDGVWNETGTSFSFYLKPYFWQTIWFYILCALTIIAVVFISYRLRVRQLKTRQKELTALVESRTREVENKNRQLEEQSEKLKEMDKIKSRFFANISHEFRTPLTLILGPLEQLIAACGEKEKETKRKLTLMLRNAQRLLRLINQLLELSKLDSGKMKLQPEKTNIAAFLKGIIASFQLLTHQKELDMYFHADAETEDIFLDIDPRKMEDIMSNLLINAVKFTPPGGEITVTLNKSVCGGPEDFVEISVSDTGPGIPVEQLDHVFDRFYQADSTYEFHQKGSGIGLALTKELVELHHGTIEARSRKDVGSVFVIHLPMASVDTADAPADNNKGAPVLDIETADINETGSMMSEFDIDVASPTSAGTLSEGAEAFGSAATRGIVLVVEDSADMRDYIKGALEPDYTVVEAEDGKEGIEKAHELIPDLIISDIMMPETDGYELCRVLKSDVRTSHVPIILLTAKASEENILQGLETGADDYITKPFNTKILSARIKNLIDIRSQLQTNINREMTLQPVKTSVSKIDREFLKDLHQAINKNLSDENFNVDQLCKKLYMSRTTLYRKVLAISGLTPTEYIRTYRLKRGAELLKKDYGTILEVAFEVGFSNSSYFAKCFKEKFHQLPSEFQAANKE